MIRHILLPADPKAVLHSWRRKCNPVSVNLANPVGQMGFLFLDAIKRSKLYHFSLF